LKARIGVLPDRSDPILTLNRGAFREINVPTRPGIEP
jgi:hypothetical protein